MENRVQVRACFTGCNIKSGKTVMQFELDPEHKGALPQLVIPVDMSSGEVLDGQEEAFPEDEEDEGAYQLPPRRNRV